MALALGFQSRRRMLRELSAVELQEWKVYSGVEPFGHVVEDRQNALLAMIGTHGQGKLEDYCFSVPPKIPMTTEEMMLAMDQYFQALGAVPNEPYR